MSDVQMQDIQDPLAQDDNPNNNSSPQSETPKAQGSLPAPTVEPDESLSDHSGNAADEKTVTQLPFAPPPFRAGTVPPLNASGFPNVSPQSMPGSGPLRSVVTSSFSVEDSSLTHPERYQLQIDPRHNALGARSGAWPFPEQKFPQLPQQSFDLSTGTGQPPASPNSASSRPFEAVRRTFSASSYDPIIRRSFSIGSDPGQIRRSFSSSSSDLGPPSSQPPKRNYYHHARPHEPYTQSLPSDFVPPKRTKVGPPRKPDAVISPRTQPQMNLSPRGAWSYQPQVPSWNSRPTMDPTGYGNYGGGLPRTTPLPPTPNWANDGPLPPTSPLAVTGANNPVTSAKLAIQVTPGGASPGGGLWQQSPPWSRSASHSSTTGGFFESPTAGIPYNQKRDDAESTRNAGESRDAFDPEPYLSERTAAESFASSRQGIFRNPPPSLTTTYSTDLRDKMKLVAEAASFAESVQGRELTDGFMEVDRKPEHHEEEKKDSDDEIPTLLLAMPEDKVALSETLCVVRENIEVFCARQADVDAPAPGRKHAVVVGQVGLRCIHCRHTTKASDRVKRAICYPSSIKRIYRTVIDMKLDHFSKCKFVPPALAARLKELKAVHSRSTGTTMQYFIKAAQSIGMQDGPQGVRLDRALASVPTPVQSKSTIFTDLTLPPVSARSTDISQRPPAVPRAGSLSGDSSCLSFDVGGDTYNRNGDSMTSSESFDTIGTSATDPTGASGPYYEGIIPLALKEDKAALSPLRCFLREQVCAFSATEDDIAVRAPTTFSIAVGQVGIGCIHCVKQNPKDRSNRAVCFPFSIGRIYQSVADIQRFHLGDCKMLPPKVKEKFLSLQSASSKGSKGLATRQYWVASAKKIGLVDTQRGIRFGRDPTTPAISKAFSLDILAQAAISVTTTSKKLVLPEDKKMIADFLYVVMEQLQPCRFTEADRNKRRVKDVGCIGVECKHCAGQVDSRKFFWSSVSAVESNFVSVHTHMLECRMIPQPLKKKLQELKKLRKEQTSKLMTGSQKAFFRRVWARLHSDEGKKEEDKNEGASSPSATPQQRSPVSTPRQQSPAGTPRQQGSPSSSPQQHSPLPLPPLPKSQPLLLEASATDGTTTSPTNPGGSSLVASIGEGMQIQFFDTGDEQIQTMQV